MNRGVACTDRLLSAWFAAEKLHLKAWEDRQISFAEQRRRRLNDFLPLIGWPIGTAEQLDDLFGAYLVAYEASWVGFDDVAPALTALHESGYRLAILSNGTSAQQNAKIASLGLSDMFVAVFTPDDLGVAKPRRAAFVGACDRLSQSPTSVLYVGDDYASDVLAARAAGLPAVYLDRRDVGPHGERHRIAALTGLADLLAR